MTIYIASNRSIFLRDCLSSSSISLPLEFNIYVINFVIFLDPKIGNILASFTYAETPSPGWALFYQLFLTGYKYLFIIYYFQKSHKQEQVYLQHSLLYIYFIIVLKHYVKKRYLY